MNAKTGQPFKVRDGLEELSAHVRLEFVAEAIAKSARWVHPDAFRALPVWYPEFARGAPSYDANWSRRYQNKNRTTGQVVEKWEPNIKAGKAFLGALGAVKTPNWTVCHIWGVDDPSFQRSNSVIRDPRFYSCVGNMVWLPTPLKGFTDAVPEIKHMLRVCAFHLYEWVCEHDDVKDDAARVRSGEIPVHYPMSWPTGSRRVLPPGTAPCSQRVVAAIAKRKAELKAALNSDAFHHYPREQVRSVLSFWRVQL